MDRQQREALIRQYKDGYREVSEALSGATDAELDARPAPGKWSAREIVHHLGDSEMNGAQRLRVLVAGPERMVLGYDQDQFSRALYYDRPIAASLDAFRAARQATAEILDRMSDADWSREGTHSEVGRYSVERWLEIYAVHAHNHAQQIAIARAAGRR